MDAALEDSGLSLDFFRSFNASWYVPWLFSFPPSPRPCRYTGLTNIESCKYGCGSSPS